MEKDQPEQQQWARTTEEKQKKKEEEKKKEQKYETYESKKKFLRVHTCVVGAQRVRDTQRNS